MMGAPRQRNEPMGKSITERLIRSRFYAVGNSCFFKPEARDVFRAILAAVKPDRFQEFVIDFTSALAERHQLAIDACAVIDAGRLAPAEPVPVGGSALKAHRDEQLVVIARENASAALARLEAASQARGVECRMQVREGDTVTILAGAVQRCDLLVCGHTRGGDSTQRSLLHSILKHCPRPAIVVPQSASEIAGQGVLVAYDGSAQAARALASFAESGLAKGRPVHVATFDDRSGRAQEHADTAKMFLQLHGISSEVLISPLVKKVGTQILEEANRVSAGLIVMGAFGQSSVREFLLGSVTRSMLDVLPVPVFLDH